MYLGVIGCLAINSWSGKCKQNPRLVSLGEKCGNRLGVGDLG